MTIGTMIYYGGMAGVAIEIILLLVMSRSFAKQRQKMKKQLI